MRDHKKRLNYGFGVVEIWRRNPAIHAAALIYNERLCTPRMGEILTNLDQPVDLAETFQIAEDVPNRVVILKALAVEVRLAMAAKARADMDGLQQGKLLRLSQASLTELYQAWHGLNPLCFPGATANYPAVKRVFVGTERLHEIEVILGPGARLAWLMELGDWVLMTVSRPDFDESLQKLRDSILLGLPLPGQQ